MSIALKAADVEWDHIAAIEPSGNQEGYDFVLNLLQGFVKTAKEVPGRWKRWIPPEDQDSIQEHLKGLELTIPKLVSRKADFIEARIKEEAECLSQIAMTPNYPIATIKLKPATLPKFTGNKCYFHRRRKDWEALQRQGEPTGSREMKKVGSFQVTVFL